MLRRLAVAAVAVGALATGAWQGLVSEYFGRVDLSRWAAEHPNPPPPHVELGPHRIVLMSTRRIVPSEGLRVSFGVGAGSKLCRSGSSLEGWTCTSDRRKYDSPLVFEHAGEIYVVGRRNLTPDGRYGVSARAGALGTIQNELAYITTAKRCSLWHWNKLEQRLGFVLDLPSRGDTCFPSRLEGGDASRVVIYDYSSDIDGPELPWAAGQRRPTYVYRHELAFED
jgi:hypothetical protein